MMRLLYAGLIILLLMLQYSLWIGEGSLADLHNLKKQVAQQQTELEQLRQRNQALEAEVKNLEDGKEAIEERARTELGMIKKDEIFYQIIPPTNELEKNE